MLTFAEKSLWPLVFIFIELIPQFRRGLRACAAHIKIYLQPYLLQSQTQSYHLRQMSTKIKNIPPTIITQSKVMEYSQTSRKKKDKIHLPFLCIDKPSKRINQVYHILISLINPIIFLRYSFIFLPLYPRHHFFKNSFEITLSGTIVNNPQKSIKLRACLEPFRDQLICYIIYIPTMLSEIQKKNLDKLLKYHNFQHLRPPPEVYEINHPEKQHFQPTSSNDKRRRIFYRVKYQPEEERAITQVKQKLHKEGISEKIPDEVILKHVYGGDWDHKKTLERLKKVIAYHYDQRAIGLCKDTFQKLENGQIYTYGHDRNFCPNVIMRMDKFDLNLDIQDHFNAVYYLMLVVLGYRMVPYHVEKYNFIMDLNNISITDIPYRYMFAALDRLGTYYCGNAEKTFVFNANGIGSVWNFISFFLPETQKKRVIFIQKGEEKKILEYIDEFELEERYGGKLPNLTKFWPPKNTSQSFDLKMNTSVGQSEFLSIENDEDYFRIEGEEVQPCGAKCECTIF